MQKIKFIFKQIKIFDIIFILLFIFAVLFSFYNIFTNRNDSAVLVANCPSGEYIYPLEKNQRIELFGILGITVVVIENGKAFVESSPCQNKNCILSGKIQKSGDWTACLPNKIILHIESKSQDIDAISK